MGSVLAASAPPPPPTLLSEDFQKSDTSLISENNTEKIDKLENPGLLEDLHKQCKDLFPPNFEGGKFMFNKALSEHFQVSHSIQLSSTVPSGYRFTSVYAGSNPSDPHPLLIGGIETNGNLDATVMGYLSERIRGKFIAQVQKSQFLGVQCTADYKANASTTSLTLVNPNMLNGSGVLIAHHLHSVTPSLALGGELAIQSGPGVPDGHKTVISGVGRYTNGNNIISGSIGLHRCQVCFYKKASQQLQLGVELDINTIMQESTGSLVYQVDIPKADLVFKGCIDSNWTVRGVLEKKLQPLPFAFTLSGMLNHNKSSFKLGCGLMIGN